MKASGGAGCSRRRFLQAAVAAGGIWLGPGGGEGVAGGVAGEPIALGRRRELLVDDYLIESMEGVSLRLHHPEPDDVVVTFDAPWEGNTCAYVTVFRDGDRYRMYYRGSHIEVGSRERREQVTCYAESDDGLRWTKPRLGLVEHRGSKENNIIWTGVAAHNFCPFKDERPGCPPEERYKAVGYGEGPGGRRALAAFVSADGLRWRPLGEGPIITDGKFDSQNLAFWDAKLGRYRAYYRDFRQGVRDIKTATSEDFVHWTSGQWLDYGDAPPEHLYTNQVQPYYRAPHLYLGFPTRYVDRQDLAAFATLPGYANRRARAAMSRRYGTAITEGLLMTSRDGVRFHRWGEAFLRPGPRIVDNWAYGDNYLAWRVVETRSPLAGYPNELSMFATEGYWGRAAKLRRYRLRVDGFVSASAGFSGGRLTTRPITFDGDRLRINYATSAAGLVAVELLDVAGRPLEGLSRQACRPVFGDQLDREVAWAAGPGLSPWRGKPVRLRFHLRDADLYAFWFEPEAG